MQRLTFKDGRGRNTILVNGQEYHGPVADRLAAYEETGMKPNDMFLFACDPEASAQIAQTILHHPLSLSDIAEMTESLAPVISLMGGWAMKHIRMWALAYAEGRLLITPCVAMIERTLIGGKMTPKDQRLNGRYAVVYNDPEKWGSPLIDICGKPYDKIQALARLRELESDMLAKHGQHSRNVSEGGPTVGEEKE